MKNPPTFLINCIALSLALACVIGCQSKPDHRIVYVPVTTTPLPREHREAVWFPDQLAPYAVGRYVDPRDPNVVHEAHTIYRREQTSRPNLTPPVAVVFPLVTYPSVSNATALLRDGLTAELNQQRTTSQALTEQMRVLGPQLRKFNEQSQEFRNALQESYRLRAQMVAVSNRLEGIEGQLRAMPAVPANQTPKATTNATQP